MAETVVNIEHDGFNLVSVTWADGTVHHYSVGDDTSPHVVRNAIANWLNMVQFLHPFAGTPPPVVRSTGDAYEQGIEYGFKLAGHWDECGITVTYDGVLNLWIVYDEQNERQIARCTTFTIVRDKIDSFMRPNEGAGGSQYERDLHTLLVTRNLTLQHLDAGFAFTDENDAVVSLHDKLDIAVTQALERTAS